MLVAIAVTTSTTIAAAVIAITAVAVTVVVLRGILFESLVLFSDVGEKVFAELFGGLDFVGIRTAG